MAWFDNPELKQKLDGLKFIPNEQRPPLYRGLYNEDVAKDPQADQDFSNSLKTQFDSLPDEKKTEIQEWSKSLPEDVSSVEKIRALQGQVLKARFEALNPETKQKVKDFFDKNLKIPVEERVEVLNQAILQPQGFVETVLTKLTKADAVTARAFKDRLGQAFKESDLYKKVYPNEQTAKMESDKTFEKIGDNMASAGQLTKWHDIMGAQTPQEMVKAEKELLANAEKDQGGFVSLFFSLVGRESQLAAAMTTAAAALYSKDPAQREHYIQKTNALVQDALSGNVWVPSKMGIDDTDIFMDLWGKDATELKKITSSFPMPRPLSREEIEADPSAFVKRDAEYSNTIRQWGSNLAVDPEKLTKEILWNSSVWLAGFAKSLIVPSSFVGGKVLQLVKRIGAPAIARLAEMGLKVEVPNLTSLNNSMKTLQREMVTQSNMLKKFPLGAAKEIDTTAHYVAGLDDIVGSASSNAQKLNVDVAQEMVKYRDLQDKYKILQESSDKIVQLHTKLSSGKLLKPEAELIARQMNDIATEARTLTGKTFRQKQGEYGVLVKDGMQTLSKTGEKRLSSMLKGSKEYDETTRLMMENTLALKAMTDPKLIEKGGIKILGLHIPKSEVLEDAMIDLMGKVPFFARFPGNNAWTIKRINEAVREFEGGEKLADDLYHGLTKNLTKEQRVRIMFASETGKTHLLDDAVDLNEYGSMKNIAAHVRKRFDTMYDQANKETQRLVMEMKKRGLPEEEIQKVLKTGGNIAGDYVENYQTLIYRNEKYLEKAKGNAALDYARALQRERDGLPLSARDRFALKREIHSHADAIKIGLSPSQGIEVDGMIDSIVKGVGATVTRNGKKVQLTFKDTVAELEKLGKFGLDPVLDFADNLRVRSTAYNKAIARKRLNIDLAQQYGIPTSMTQYYAESAGLKAVDAIDFAGVAIPKEVRGALKELDADPWRVALTKKIKDADSPAEAVLASGQLGMLKTIDKVNNFFSKSVTVVWPKFHTKNAMSSVTMNIMDIGAQTISPRNNYKVASLLANDGNVEALNKLVFKNKFGQVMTGEEMMLAAKENGIFVKMSKTLDVKGATEYAKDFGLNGPLAKVGQRIEDQGRLLNFVANWQRGHTFSESAARSRKFMIDYGNMTTAEREFVGRVVPFYQFFKGNFVNTVETIIRDPKRIIIPSKVMVRGVMDARFQAPPEGVKLYPGQVPAFRENEDGSLESVSSIAATVEDVDRFTGFIKDFYAGLTTMDDEMSAKEARDAAKEFSRNIFPVMQMPLVAFDQLINTQYNEVFRNVPVSDTIGKYLATTPPTVRKMVGLDFIETPTGKYKAVISPIANIAFTMMGGGRALSTQRLLDEQQGDFLDAMASLISPITTKKIDVDQAKILKAESKLREAEYGKRVESKINKGITDHQKKMIFLNQVKKEEKEE